MLTDECVSFDHRACFPQSYSASAALGFAEVKLWWQTCKIPPYTTGASQNINKRADFHSMMVLLFFQCTPLCFDDLGWGFLFVCFPASIALDEGFPAPLLLGSSATSTAQCHNFSLRKYTHMGSFISSSGADPEYDFWGARDTRAEVSSSLFYISGF